MVAENVAEVIKDWEFDWECKKLSINKVLKASYLDRTVLVGSNKLVSGLSSRAKYQQRQRIQLLRKLPTGSLQ